MKVWMVLFCCMNTGALHMEVGSKLSTTRFLLIGLASEPYKATRCDSITMTTSA